MKKEIKVRYYFDDKDYSEEETILTIQNLIRVLAKIKGVNIDENLLRKFANSIMGKNSNND